MTLGWQEKPFESCLDRFRVTAKIPKKQFADEGQFPIVSQEADFINGYWDSEADVCSLEAPVVIYGDHTQVVKYVDFDFVVGADGVKVLKPKDFMDPRFLYYFVMAHRVPSLGYARHYRHLKDQAIKYPPLEEQQRIVAVLDEAFEGLARARTHAEANLQNAQELFESAVEAALERAGGEPVSLQEMMDKGMITSHLDGNHGSDYPRKAEFVSEGVPYISANCIAGNEIDFGRCKYLTPERANGLRKGVAKNRDVLFAHNATVGPVTLLKTEEEKVILSTSLTYYRCNEDELIPEFLVFEMRSAGFRRQYEAVMAQATRNQVPITMQRKFTHLIPPLAEQRRIAELGVELEAKCNSAVTAYEASVKDTNDLRQSLLQKAFAGELT